MRTDEALEALTYGHAIWRPGYARKVCDALGVPFDQRLVHYGAVAGFQLAYHVAKELGVAGDAQVFVSRGRQAVEYARVVRQRLDSRSV